MADTDETCETCYGQKFVLGDAGDVVRCPKCNAAPAVIVPRRERRTRGQGPELPSGAARKVAVTFREGRIVAAEAILV
jgi:hypothetical protein